MFVACSTLCFARQPLESALRQIAELEFDKFELALVEDGSHLRPSTAGDDPEGALHRLRSGPSLIPSSLYIDFGPVDVVKYAEAFGAKGMTIRAPEEITPVLKRALDYRNGPVLIGVNVDYSDNHKLFEMVHADTFH